MGVIGGRSFVYGHFVLSVVWEARREGGVVGRFCRYWGGKILRKLCLFRTRWTGLWVWKHHIMHRWGALFRYMV